VADNYPWGLKEVHLCLRCFRRGLGAGVQISMLHACGLRSGAALGVIGSFLGPTLSKAGLRSAAIPSELQHVLLVW